jgi:hypothetical protein
LPAFTTNALVWGRDAGNSARFGSDVVWIFGDSFTWSGLRCATAAWSSVDEPTRLTEDTNDWLAPVAFYPFSETERTYNDAHEGPPDCCSEQEGCTPGEPYCHCDPLTDCWTRIAIWPGDIIPTSETGAINFYEKVLVGTAPYDFRHLGTGVALLERGSTTSKRPLADDGEPLLIFGPTEPNFLRATGGRGESADFVYLFASTNRAYCAVDIVVARAPRASLLDRSAYRFWNGSAWTADLRAAEPILREIRGGLGSVTWNDHLGRYLSAFSDICAGGTELLLRTAPAPHGPWSEPLTVDLSGLGADADSYAGQIHASLGSDRSLIISFYKPLRGIEGRVHLARITLQ